MKVSASKPSDSFPNLRCAFCRRGRKQVWCLFLSDFEHEHPASNVAYICDLCVKSASDFVNHQAFVRTTDACNFCGSGRNAVKYMIEAASRTRICNECIDDARGQLGWGRLVPAPGISR